METACNFFFGINELVIIRTNGILQVSITLETSENISQRYLHPSRRNSATITKVSYSFKWLTSYNMIFSILHEGILSQLKC